MSDELENIEALIEVVREYHKNSIKKGSIVTQAFCVCGNSSGGPIGTKACRGLHILLNKYNYDN